MLRCIAPLVGALLISASSSAQSKPASPVDSLLAKLDSYLTAYEPRLSHLIADETMTQETKLPASYAFLPREAVPAQPARRRSITSEVAFIALPENTGWLGFRHVKTVDERSIDGNGISLGSMLQSNRYDAASELVRAGAQYNLGLARTTNLPNLPLEFLHQRNRKRFLVRSDGRESIDGIRAARVVAIERVTPTMIKNPDSNADMPSVVRAWINEQTGQLLKAEVRTFVSFEAKEPDNSLQVEFAEHKALGMLVPVRMLETFAAERPSRGDGVATYANFRRFQTSARIVPQP